MKIVALHIITKSRIALAMLIALSCTIGAVDALAQLPVRAREVRLLSNNNTNYVSLQAPNGLASNWNLLAPLTVGVSNAIPITTVTGSNSQLSWIAPGANGTVLGIVAGAPSWTTFPGWNVLGNAGTNEATNFLGTTDAQDLLIRSNNQNRIRVNQEALSGVDVSRPVSVDGSYNVLGLSMNMTNGPSHNVATDGTRMLMNSLDFGSGGVAGAAQTGTLYGNWTRFWMQRGVGTTYNDLVGNYFHWQANNTAVIGTLTGYFSERRSGATNNTVGTLYQFRAELPGNGTVTNLYGFHMGTPLGTVTNIYGVNIENLPAGGAPAGKYAFRYNGSAGNVPFSVMASGQVGIGTLSPAATSLLEVTGTAGTANIRAGSLSGASLVSAYAPGVNDGLVTVDVNGDLLKRTFSSALDPTAWLLAGNAGATASSFIGPTTASVPLNFATANAVPGSMNFYLGTVAPANVRMSLSTGSGFLIGNATNSVNTSITGTLNSTGTTTLASANLSNVSLLSAVIPGTFTVNGTALTPNVTMTSLSGAAKAAVPAGYDRIVLSNSTGSLDEASFAAVLGTAAWTILGNTAINPATNFLGTTDAQPLVIRTLNTERLRVLSTGEVGIGTALPLANSRVTLSAVAATAGVGLNVDMTGTTTSSGIVVRNIGNTGASDAGILLGSTANGTGAGIRIGSIVGLNDPDLGIEIEASTNGVTYAPTNTGNGVGFRAGTSAGSRPRMGVETYARSSGASNGVAILADANSTGASTGIGVGALVSTSGTTGNLWPLVVSSADNRDVYLGSTVADLPASLVTTLTGTANASITRMHSARLSGTLTMRGTSTGVTSFTAGAQGATNIAYTLPIAAPAANGYVMSSTTAGVMSWTDPGALGILEEVSGVSNIRRRAAYVQGGIVGTPGTGAIDLQGNRAVITQTATGNYSGVLSGRDNTAAAIYSVVGGGISNSIGSNDNYSVIAGGDDNDISASSTRAFIGSGGTNVMTGSDYTAIVTGLSNSSTSSLRSFIGSGWNNRLVTSSNSAAIVSGQDNTLTQATHSFIGAGITNTMTNSNYAAIVSGNTNTIASSTNGIIVGGSNNTVQTSSNYSVIGGGQDNIITSSTNAFIAGGASNSILTAGNHSAIWGGRNLTITGSRSAGFNSGTMAMTIATDNVVAFGSTNVWLANNTNTPSQLRFYEAQAGAGTFPGVGTNFSAFQAGAQIADITYTLPIALPPANNYVLATTTAGVLSWFDPAGLAGWALTGNATTTAWNGAAGSFLGTTSTQPLTIATTNATPQDITFFSGVSGATKRMEIDGTTGYVGIGNITPAASMDIDGGLVVRPPANVAVAANGQTVTPANRSYVVLDPGVAARTGLILANGLQPGQLLILRILETATGSVTLPDVVGSNVDLTGDWVGAANDILSLIWTGTDWIETSRSNN